VSGGEQLTFDLPHRAALRRENFLVAPCNLDAVTWIDRWPEWPGPATCLHGPAGCGKSHLLEVWRVRSDARICNADLLAEHGPAYFANAGAVALDDAEQVRDEVALFHLFNLVKEAGGYLLLAAATPPGRWAVELPDLRSRLNASTAIGVSAPDDVLLSSLLAKLFADRQLKVTEDVIGYAVRRMERSFDAARRLVAALDALALAEKRAVGLSMVRDTLNRMADAA